MFGDFNIAEVLYTRDLAISSKFTETQKSFLCLNVRNTKTARNN